MSFHRACCCGGGPYPGCPSGATCDACGDLVWSMHGTLIWEQFGAGGGFLQRQTWVLTSAAVKTRNIGGTASCTWTNIGNQDGSPDADFLGFSGTYVLDVAGAPIRVASFNFQPVTGAPSTLIGDSPWLVGNLCDLATAEEDLIFRMGVDYPYGINTRRWAATDQNGNTIYVDMPPVTFTRIAMQDCPLGTFNASSVVDNPGVGTWDFPSVPFLEVSLA